jgi:hypothetical protein
MTSARDERAHSQETGRAFVRNTATLAVLNLCAALESAYVLKDRGSHPVFC